MGALFTPGYTVDETVTVDASVTVDTEGSFYPTIPPLSATDFTARLLSLYPRGWVGDDAKNPGGVAYAIFEGIGATLASFLSQMQFIANGLRIKLAYGTALDTISVDYFGVDGLPRNPGESDTSFRARILQTLLFPRVTRAAIQNAIEVATGITPRMGEPWSPGDCSSWDVHSYYGIDGPENIAPGRYGDGIPYTAFIDITSPISTSSGGFPIYALDIGAAFDVGTAAFDLANGGGGVSVNTSFVSTVSATVQAFKAFGITIGVRYTANGALNNTIGGVVASTTSSSQMALADTTITFTLQSWLQSFGLWLEVLPWLATCYFTERGVDFSVAASAPAPSGYTVAWLAAIYESSLDIALRVGVNAGQTSVACAFAIPSGTIPVISTDWSTLSWITGFTSNSLNIALSVAGPGNLDIIFLPGASLTIPSGTAQITVDAVLPSAGYGLFATPSWQTTMAVYKGAGYFILSFGTAPSVDSTLYWAAVANGSAAYGGNTTDLTTEAGVNIETESGQDLLI